MSYRDAAKYKDSVPEKISVKHTRKTVMKRMIGIAGTCENIGVTHNAIVLANFFRQKGYMVALVEKTILEHLKRYAALLMRKHMRMVIIR